LEINQPTITYCQLGVRAALKLNRTIRTQYFCRKQLNKTKIMMKNTRMNMNQKKRMTLSST
jgi:hypothetical protein